VAELGPDEVPVANPPDGLPRIVPRLAYRDAGSAADWLCRVFGLTERRRLEAPDGIVLIELELDGSVVHLGPSGAHGIGSPVEHGGLSQVLVVYVDDVDDHARRARAGGADLLYDPEDTVWGDRRYEALDLEKHRWYFAQHVRDVGPEEWPWS
jgi:uncharacterized glyoxalase superfamily protein PhnB